MQGGALTNRGVDTVSYVYITEEGATLSKHGGRLIVSRNNEVVFELPLETIEAVVFIGNIQVTSQTIVELLERGVPLTWLSDRGKYFGRLEPTTKVNVEKQYAQIRLLEDANFCLELARKIVLAKVDNQIVVLRRYNRNSEKAIDQDITNIYSIRKNIFTAKTVEELMGFEGFIARCYFHALGKIVPETFSFEKRSRRPPKDAFNSMLSFAYTLVTYEIYTAINNYGLHPYFGFLHSIRNGHPALASDLLEEWRAVLVDAMVLSLVQHHEILPDDFEVGENEGVYLTREGRKTFLNAFEHKMRTNNQYLGTKMTFRDSLNYQVGALSKAITVKSAVAYE
jgi:CRISPR-associated protein Cas1